MSQATGFHVAAPVEVWIDAGGTFTDCVARDRSGALRTHKVLSTGAVRGCVGPGSDRRRIVDPARGGDPPEFFRGWMLRLPPAQEAVRVAGFDPATGTLALERPLAAAPAVGAVYELFSGQPAPLVGARWLLGLPSDAPLRGVALRVGTTIGTNALLERRGATTALLISDGFRDLLTIGDQTRPRLFDLHIRRGERLFGRVVEVRGRIDAGGRELEPLDPAGLEGALRELRAAGCEALAVCLLNACCNPVHEQFVGAAARGCGFAHVSLSSEVAPLPRMVVRGETTVVDAFLGPVLGRYVAALERDLPDQGLWMMTSAGALTPGRRFRARDSVLSGPAGGVLGAAETAAQAGETRVIGLDMGGTSTDVCRIEGPPELRYELRLAAPEGGGLRVLAPVLAIETVAAGGGSICSFDGVKPTVGPHSAGADPGPACYGQGGPLCLTDVNLLLGRIDAAQFPFPLDLNAAQRRLDELIRQIAEAAGRRYEREELAEGFVAIADAHLASAVRRVSLARGFDPRAHALVAFGGAGGQHACALAEGLGIARVVLPPLASVLSAVGIGSAPRARHAVRALGVSLEEGIRGEIEQVFEALCDEAAVQLDDDGVDRGRREPVVRVLELRYQGQDEALAIGAPPGADWRATFEAAHQQRYGFRFDRRPVEIVSARVELRETRSAPPPPAPVALVGEAEAGFRRRVFHGGAWIDVAGYRRGELRAGMTLRGPAIVGDPASTIWITPGWRGEVLGDGALRLTRCTDEQVVPAAEQRGADPGATGPRADDLCVADPVALELFHQRFSSVAEEMGAMLQRTALSTNVKERLDFSCALYDAAGNLVAHAPHIPVHLGALGHCVRCLMEDFAGRLRPGEVYVTNDPDRGGSHLPDVTVITPVFRDDGAVIDFFVANRAHHAEIGGIAPGSMPPHSRTLAEEGVLIRTRTLVAVDPASGRPVFEEAALRELLSGGAWPSRQVEQNLADLRAQTAANHCGVARLREMVAEHGGPRVRAYMGHIQRVAERKVRRALAAKAGRRRFADALDDGTPIVVSIEIDSQGGARFDFAGSGGVHPGNFNASPAIVASAVIYALRCLIDEETPLNAGLLAPVEIHVPPGLLAPPAAADPSTRAAVVAGNVETSQRLVDCIFGALELCAAGQGTMNNLAFGDGRFGYYETIGGGAGAGPGFDGASGVHVHMTNTRLTDPEVLEARYPARVRRFELRSGSGGAGRWRGGDGILREIEFLAPLEVSLLTQRRTRAPFGLMGGGAARAGENWLLRPGCTPERLAGCVQIRVQPGDVLRIETPGGGGYGPAEQSGA